MDKDMIRGNRIMFQRAQGLLVGGSNPRQTIGL